MKKNERLDALRILLSVFEQNTSLSHALQAHPDLSPLSKALCFGVCRYYNRLQAIADQLVKKRPNTLDLWILLLMGLYQLDYLRTPDYAVVKETVTLATRLKKSWAKGLINAVLRTFCRERTQRLAALENTPAFYYNHPAWFVQRLKTAWPQQWETILQANDTQAPMSLRVNQRQHSRTQYLQALQTLGLTAHPHTHSPCGITLDKPCEVTQLPNFSTGAVSVQDEAAQLAVSLLDLKPNQRVLDACCAPGGKTCHLLEAQSALDICIALDADAKRLQRVKENLTRLHLHAHVIHADAQTPSHWWDGQLFDRILLDAPCSATGVIRRHPDIKHLRTPQDITHIAQLQHRLLEALWPLLAPGGLLLYATCSVMPEENEQQIARWIQTHPDCQLSMPASLLWGHATGHGQQILPGEEGMDGFFYSVLRKTTHEPPAP